MGGAEITSWISAFLLQSYIPLPNVQLSWLPGALPRETAASYFKEEMLKALEISNFGICGADNFLSSYENKQH